MNQSKKPDLLEKIMRPFQKIATEMTKEERIEYLCLKSEMNTSKSEPPGITRQLYRMAAEIIVRDTEFIDSLTPEERKLIKDVWMNPTLETKEKSTELNMNPESEEPEI